jgi:hypothetical protein
VLHKPFDVDRVVDLVRDCAALHRDERKPRTASLQFATSSDEDAPAS